MTSKRTVGRRLEAIENDEAELTPEAWVDEFADQKLSAGPVTIVDADPDEESKADHEGVLVTTIGNEHYVADIRAHPEEIPDQFDREEDFPV